ncbi:MAG: YlmH/Sll1252 family protein [Erysipelotrichaceae bacterium]|nr:YlmH/Sll1252 family protein [Erysipelotrichaceae bacterium]
MLEHYKGEEVFVKKILDYKDQALYQQRMILTPFYNPHEQDIVRSVIGHDLKVYSYGGFINCENSRMIICPDFYDIVDDDFDVVLVSIDYHEQYGKLRHQDVLGALMNQGIKREFIGDIYIDDKIYFACSSSTYPYLRDSLSKIKKSKVHLSLCHKKIEITHDYMTKTFIVSSFRLDKIIASMFRLSRSKAVEAIQGGNVKVDYKIVEEVSFLCHNGNVISLRHHGRVKLVDEQKETRSNNHVITGYFYK